MKKKHLLPSLVITLFLITNCKKESEIIPEPKNLGTLLLTNEELNMNPYQVNDVMLFSDSLGDTTTYKIISRSNFYGKTHSYGVGTGPSIDYYEYQKNSTMIEDEYLHQYHFALQANLDQKAGFTISLGINTPEIDVNPNSFAYLFDSTGILNNPENISSTFHSSITINGTNYNSVYELNTYVAYGEIINRLFYSVTEGIVGFKTNENKSWNLVQ